MIYILDTNSLSVFKNFYPTTFPTFWEELAALVGRGEIVSAEEVYNEAIRRVDSEHLAQWIEANKNIFDPPTEEEMAVVAEIFAVEHFQQLVSEDAILRGGLVADPWFIARARVLGGCVVTEEKLKPNAAKIPNVCEHFRVPCTNVEGFLTQNGWRY
jgi:hypothetical protein